MKFKKMALTLAASFALVACDNGTEEQARRDAERAIADKMGAVEAVQQDQKALTTKLQQGQLPATTQEATPETNLETLEKRADGLADRLNASSNPKADTQLGSDIREFLVDVLRDKSITDAQFNALTGALDATKATAASGIVFTEAMARNKRLCQRTIKRVENMPNSTKLAAPLISRCMNR